jgi:hypothetical protein
VLRAAPAPAYAAAASSRLGMNVMGSALRARQSCPAEVLGVVTPGVSAPSFAGMLPAGGGRWLSPGSSCGRGASASDPGPCHSGGT